MIRAKRQPGAIRHDTIPRCEACGGVFDDTCVIQLVGLVKDGLTPQLKIATKWAIGWLEAREPMKIKLPRPDWTTTKRKHMVLTGANAEAFLEAMAAPPLPNERLVEAIRRYRLLVG